MIVRPLSTTQVYTIGMTVQFNCSITPNPLNIDPTVNLRYYWYLSGSSRSRYFIRSLSNASIYIHQGFSKINKILCEVRANGIAISHGHFLMEVQGNNYYRATKKVINNTFMNICTQILYKPFLMMSSSKIKL